MNIEAARPRQVQPTDTAEIRQAFLQMLAQQSDRKVQQARNTADLLEYGHHHEARSGAAALLLDVLA